MIRWPLGIKNDLGGLMVRARRRAGLTQGEVSARIGTTQSAVSRWENGHEEPRLSNLVAVLRACGLQAELLVDDDVDRTQIRQQLAMSPRQRLQGSMNVSRLRSVARSRR